MTAEPTTTDCPYQLDVLGRDHHAENAALRERGPVVQVELPGGLLAWAVNGYQELQALLADPRIAKNSRHWSALAQGLVPEGWPLLGMITVPGMITSDGEDHRRLRALVSKAFTPRRVAELRPHVEQVAAELLDAMEAVQAVQTEAAAPGDQPLDLCEAYSYPLPMRVIAELLGVPRQHLDPLHAHSRALVSSSASRDQALEAQRGMAGIMAAVVQDRRSSPGADLTSALIAVAEADGDHLSEAELVGTMTMLLVAGHGTTLNLLGNAVRALSANPDQRALVLAGTVPWSAVVEETLRQDSPVAHFPLRYALEDISTGGVVIKAGDAILASYAATGRDPRQFPRADRFDLTRSPVRHLGLGHGLHFCLGAPLARLEAEVALRALYTRFPDLTVAQGAAPRPIPSFVSNGVVALPVRLRG
jgi:cytochrome P450